jgi:hypothetical protein
MSNRRAIVTQAEVARIIRAAQAAGLTVERIVARADGVAIETSAATAVPERRPVECERPVVL